MQVLICQLTGAEDRLYTIGSSEEDAPSYGGLFLSMYGKVSVRPVRTYTTLLHPNLHSHAA